MSSLISLIILRKYLKKRFFGETPDKSGELYEEFIGKTAIAETDLKAGATGKVTFKGTSWSAISDVDVETGNQVKITNKESITLHVTKK